MAAAIILGGVVGLASAGCRNGSEQDLVLRELRRQEDQIYAMEDYIAEYQSLLRQARAENRKLKSEGARQEGELPAPPTKTNVPSQPRRSPSISPRAAEEPPESAPPTTPDPPRNTAPTIPEPMPLESLDIPSLDETTSGETRAEELRLVSGESEDAAYGPTSPQFAMAEIASGEEFANSGDHFAFDAEPHNAVADSEALSTAPETGVNVVDRPATDAWLHGEVIANDLGRDRGAKLIVDVEPLTDAGRTASFSGRLSLMVLAPGDGGRPRSLARWDFTSDDLDALAPDAVKEGTFRFYLELPKDARTNQARELWVRLMSDSGEKILAHAAINFDEAGHFSSLAAEPHLQKVATDSRGETDELSLAPVADRKRTRTTTSEPIDVNDGSWTIGLPGQSPMRAADSKQTSDSAWRQATQAIPSIASRPSEPSPSRSHNQVEQAIHLKTAIDKGRQFMAPTWSPERSGPSADMPLRDQKPLTNEAPVWSPER